MYCHACLEALAIGMQRTFAVLESFLFEFSLQKHRIFFRKSANFMFIFVLRYLHFKEKMCTIEIEDGRNAP